MGRLQYSRGAVRVELATDAELPALESCFASNPGYWRLHGGRESTIAGDPQLLLREAEADDQRYCMVVREKGGSVVGFLDVQLGYPTPDCACVVLMMVHAAHQGRGVGRTAVEGLEDWLAEQDYRSLGLAVDGRNLTAQAFWQGCGFTEMEAIGRGVTASIWMEKTLEYPVRRAL